jgi:hypothetical protein
MEKKYTAELDDALAQYGSLRAQTAAVDPVELMEARRLYALKRSRTPLSGCREPMTRSLIRLPCRRAGRMWRFCWMSRTK